MIKDIAKAYKEHFSGNSEASNLAINTEYRTIKFAFKNYLPNSNTNQFIIMSFVKRLDELGYPIKNQKIYEQIEQFRGKITYFTFEFRDLALEKRVTRPSMKILLGLS